VGFFHLQQGKNLMKPIIWNLVDWCVLAAIVWAHQWQKPTAERLLEAAHIWAWLVNLLILIQVLGLLVSHKERDHWRASQQQRSQWQRLHSGSSMLISLAVFGWVGWLWTFGIRLGQVFVLEILRGEGKS